MDDLASKVVIGQVRRRGERLFEGFKQALHLAAFGLLLALNLVEGELKCAAGRQPNEGDWTYN